MDMQIPHTLTVISPHLDDAVFSCGCLIAASQAPLVITVFAGVPPHDTPAPEWDQAAGFTTGSEAVQARRKEDARALGILGAEPVWLDFLDGQYGERYEAVEIAVRLGKLLAMRQHGTIVAPLGLFHTDHILVNAACMLVRAPTPRSMQWLFYEDAIHRRMPGVVQSRMLAWSQEGLLATPVHLPICAYASQKASAVEAYESQLPLFNAHQLADLCGTERYWSIGP